MTTITKTMSNRSAAPSTPSDSGIVARTIGTAPRSPANEMKASSLTFIGCTSAAIATEIGRAALQWALTFVPQLPVVAFTEVHNLASRAVMRHLLMRDAGVIHREGLVEGRPGLHADAPFALYRAD